MQMFGKFHCHTETIRNVNCRMQYFPKENPVKFRSYYKITLNPKPVQFTAKGLFRVSVCVCVCD